MALKKDETQKRWLLALPLFLTSSCIPPISGPFLVGGERPGLQLPYELSGLLTDDAPSLGGFPVRHALPAIAQPFVRLAGTIDQARRASDCLTAAVYYEARSEGEAGQRAVAQVVLNRVRHYAFPSTICAVVYQGSSRRTGCQFSFTCDGSLRARQEPRAWSAARRVAEDALDGYVYAPVGLATHYHTVRVRPDWRRSLSATTIVGAHIFYRGRGYSGVPAAFVRRFSSLEPVLRPPRPVAREVAYSPAIQPASNAQRLNPNEVAMSENSARIAEASLVSADALASLPGGEGPGGYEVPFAVRWNLSAEPTFVRGGTGRPH